MSDSYPFPVFSGVLDPVHYKHINQAIWLFLWCISSTTKDVEKEGTMWGLVLGNKPVKYSELTERFDVSESTIKRWVKELEKHEYIKTVRSPYGLIYYVKNSKKFAFKNELSPVTDSSKMTYQGNVDSSNVTYLPFKNDLSNKDITEDVVVVVDEDDIFQKVYKVEQYFLQKRGKGLFSNPNDFNEIKQVVADGIPLEIIFKAIDLSFAEYKPKHKRDEIRSFSYCAPRCYSECERTKKVEKSVIETVPNVSIALRQPHQAEAMKSIANEAVSQVEALRQNATGPSEEMMRKVRELRGATT